MRIPCKMNGTTFEDDDDSSADNTRISNSAAANGLVSLGATSGADHGKLEDYIVEIQNRQNNTLVAAAEAECDLQTQLAAKEKDLIFAAELGKALLERNEELTRNNERITEEYSHKLEVSLCSLCFSGPVHYLYSNGLINKMNF